MDRWSVRHKLGHRDRQIEEIDRQTANRRTDKRAGKQRQDRKVDAQMDRWTVRKKIGHRDRQIEEICRQTGRVLDGHIEQVDSQTDETEGTSDRQWEQSVRQTDNQDKTVRQTDYIIRLVFFFL